MPVNTAFLSGDTTNFSNISLIDVTAGRAQLRTSRVSSTASILGNAIWASTFSVGGFNLPTISSISSLIGAFVVQGSASSFTVVTFTGVAVGDIILTGVIGDTAVSSISSGLVPHSHVTQADQIEFRLSNVSTLVQNQSSKSWVFTRIRPF